MENDELLDALRQVDSRVTKAVLRPLNSEMRPVSPPNYSVAVMTVALAAAAAAAAAVVGAPERHLTAERDIEGLKKRIDGAATAAAEEIFEKSDASIIVKAGEGARDDSPGAQLGQTFGSPGTGGKAQNAVLDYVDGTGLAARGLHNALALGGLAGDINRSPDLKVFAVLAPGEVLAQLEFNASPAHLATTMIHTVAEYLDCAPRKLRILTHSRDVGRAQDPWYDELGGQVGDLVVPDPVSVEPLYLLPLALRGDGAVNGMIGVMGLVELVYSSLLLDLTGSPYRFKFRLVSKTAGKDLIGSDPAAFILSTEDVATAEREGIDPQKSHVSNQFLTSGSASAAAMFAVTDCPLLGMTGSNSKFVEGILLDRVGGSRLRVEFDRSSQVGV